LKKCEINLICCEWSCCCSCKVYVNQLNYYTITVIQCFITCSLCWFDDVTRVAGLLFSYIRCVLFHACAHIYL